MQYLAQLVAVDGPKQSCTNCLQAYPGTLGTIHAMQTLSYSHSSKAVDFKSSYHIILISKADMQLGPGMLHAACIVS